MEYSLESLLEDNTEEDVERLQRRKARTQRMRREKRIQMRRRRKIKLLFIKSMVVIVPVLILFIIPSGSLLSTTT